MKILKEFDETTLDISLSERYSRATISEMSGQRRTLTALDRNSGALASLVAAQDIHVHERLCLSPKKPPLLTTSAYSKLQSFLTCLDPVCRLLNTIVVVVVDADMPSNAANRGIMVQRILLTLLD